MRLRVAIVAVLVPLVLWGLLPVLSDGASPSGRLDSVQRKIDITRGKIGRRKGTERVLSTQIGAYSQKIGRLQSSIGRLRARQRTAEADLSAKRDELYKIQDDLRTQRRRLVRLKARLDVTERRTGHTTNRLSRKPAMLPPRRSSWAA